jgi:hypothetical protein
MFSVTIEQVSGFAQVFLWLTPGEPLYLPNQTELAHLNLGNFACSTLRRCLRCRLHKDAKEGEDRFKKYLFDGVPDRMSDWARF